MLKFLPSEKRNCLIAGVKAVSASAQLGVCPGGPDPCPFQRMNESAPFVEPFLCQKGGFPKIETGGLQKFSGGSPPALIFLSPPCLEIAIGIIGLQSNNISKPPKVLLQL